MINQVVIFNFELKIILEIRLKKLFINSFEFFSSTEGVLHSTPMMMIGEDFLCLYLLVISNHVVF